MGRAGKFAVHVFLAFLAAFVSCAICVGGTWPVPAIFASALGFAACAAAVELVIQIERAPWRFVALGDILRLARSSALSMSLFTFVVWATPVGLPGGWRSALLTLMVYPGFLAALRIMRRAAHEGSLIEVFTGGHIATRAPLLIVGEAHEADAFLRAPTTTLGQTYAPIGVVSPTAKEIGEEFRGVCVLGDVAQFDDVLMRLRESNLSPAAILFLSHPASLPGLGPERLGRLKSEGVRLLRQPGVVEFAKGPSVAGLREISLEELLARTPVQLDMSAARELVAGKRVLVTGAGGSIGSEICRQVAGCEPASLTMLDSSEGALFQIGREIAEAWPGLTQNEVLCDIRDRARLSTWFAQAQPQIVFHAAALKHVPLVESHPCEGVLTNVFGTRNVVEAARAVSADHMVMISTDKAVDPSSVMGATKRMAETLVRTSAGPTRFSVVRFGNVLGSAGSVATVFQHQIERGGPVTITDLDVERYFMTIPEAVKLVLRAAALSATAAEPESGVLTLEMGEPVKIVDLARRMIELNGLVPDRDIEIQVVGLRPGEKLSEELVDIGEVARARAPGILEAVPGAPLTALAETDLAALEAQARQGDAAAVRATLFRIVEQTRQLTAARRAS
ncbi:polysaccharide biosynthesis protein [Caulobacter sp. NIBR2454]|uniref:polysaccharide biosynthesis protein n=1 Tax=Caulobacter sp. NIBR2454 TaxID=3015996 RepID=UPI0022B630C4|nr:nucleoside-diphosphate sugar epimerase/dehydratase [Caulobacter sp. NIBR2454]